MPGKMFSLCTGRPIAAVVLVFTAMSSQSATVAPVSITDLLQKSEMIIDGTVLQIDTRSSPDSAAIHTIVSFQVNELIKGTNQAAVLQVSFLGGMHNGAGMLIPGLIYPEFGERGVYFFEKPDRTQINPIYGWDQGHFIVDDPGAGDSAIIYTVGFRQIYDVHSTIVPQGQRLSSNTAAGIQTDPDPVQGDPLTIGEFKSRLYVLLNEIENADARGKIN